MSWSPQFVRDLTRAHLAPRFILEQILTTDGVTSGISFATHDRLLSTVMIRGNAGTLPIIADDGIRVQGSRLSLREWTIRLGGFSVDIIADNARWMSQLSKGSLFALKCGFSGYSPQAFQTVALGQFVNVTRSGVSPRWTLQFRDIISALQSRWSTTASEQSLFYSLGTTTTVSTAYTAGTGGALEVASTANFDAPTGYDAALKVSTSNGDWYTYYTGTSAMPISFTGLPTADQFGTAQTDAAVSDVVTDVARLFGEPLKVFASVLASTGGGTNGSYDIYPKSWGYGLDEKFIDVHDIALISRRSSQPSGSGSADIDLIVDGEKANGLSWLNGWMSSLGCWPVIRQGQISARAIMPGSVAVYSSIDTTPNTTSDPVDGSDIVEVISWQAFHPDYPGEYYSVTTSHPSADGTTTRTSSATTESISHLPSLDTVDFALEGLFGAGGDDVRDNVRDRMSEWYLRIPEVIRLRVRTLTHARLVPGDMIPLSTVDAQGRLSELGYDRRRCLVTEVTPDWLGSSVVLELAILPDKSDEFD